jgi:hypothetical protein
MPGPSSNAFLDTVIYVDEVSGTGGAMCTPYSPFSFLTSSQLAAQTGGGAIMGTAACVSPVPSGLITDRVAGISSGAVMPGQEVGLVKSGKTRVFVNSAVAYGAQLFVVATYTKATNVAPIVNLPEVQIPFPAELASLINYCFAAVAAPAIVPNTTAGDAVRYFPVGWARVAATAQFQVIDIEIDTHSFFA